MPANGFQGADTDADVVIDFSERMRYATLTGNSIRLREQGSGAVVSTNRTIEDQPDPDGDGPLQAYTRVTLSHGPLASERLYLIDVLKSIEDLSGRSPAFDFHSTFRTRDTVPPQVLGVSPDNDPDGLNPVGPDVVPIVSCSESMDPESVTASTVQLLDGDGQPVETILDLQREGYDIRIRPTTALDLDTYYTVVVDGVTDAAGLALAEPYSWTFRVRDIEPPVVTLLLPEGALDQDGVWTALEGREVSVLVAVTSNDALRTVAINVDGVPLVVESGATPGLFRGVAMMPVGAPSVVLGAAAEDVSGNISAIATRELVVVDDQPPTGTIVTEPAGPVLPNHVVSITIDVQDDHGLRSAYLSTSGVATQEWTIQLSGTADLDSREVRIPPDAVVGSQLLISCEVEDTLGQRIPLTPVALTISADSSPPVVTVVSPEPGEVFEANDVVSFSFDLQDEVAVESTSLEVDGEPLDVTLDSVVAPGDSWTAHVAADWVLPEVPDTTDLEWTFTATDFSGNIESVSGSVTVTPFGGIGAPQVAFTCPTSGAFMPTGYDNLILSAESTDDEGIVQVEFFNGDEKEPFSVHTWTSPRKVRNTTSVPTTLPLTAGPVDMRVRAYDEGGRWRETSVTIDVMDAVELDAAGGNNWSALEDQFVYLKSGELLIDEPRTVAGLMVLNGASISHSECEPGNETRLDLTVTGPLYVGCGALIDVSGKGYGGGKTFEGEVPATAGYAGSHIGEGYHVTNATGSVGSTYGSVYRPLECGAGGALGNQGTGGLRGGGVVRVTAEDLLIEATGRIRANSEEGTTDVDGAGGSVWITVDGAITGTGLIEAGSFSTYGYENGGGAISLEFGSISDGIRANTRVNGGGGSGTVYLRHSAVAESLGEILVDNRGRKDQSTVLPSLGAGTAGAGSGGAIAASGLDKIAPYFVGHWVEITDHITGEVKGTWRISEVIGELFRLESSDGETINVVEGDSWRGLYRFDKVSVVKGSVLTSADPIWTTEVDLRSDVHDVSFEGVETTDVTGRLLNVTFDGPLTIAQSANFGGVGAAMLTLKSGSTIRPYSWGTAVDLNITGDVVVETGARIDATANSLLEAYPDDRVRQYLAGGSHLGYGGSDSNGTPVSTFGSVTRPRESGGSGYGGQKGGGAVRIIAQNLHLLGDASIKADGDTSDGYADYGGAGGSVWVSVDEDVVGTGLITASGGGPGWGRYSGGGGAVSVECRSIDPAVTLEANGFDTRPGGAGTVYLRTAGHNLGDLTVAAGAESTTKFTSLRGLGYGEAKGASSGPILETGLILKIPSYFVGHWVEIRDVSDQIKGIWRIGSIAGDSVELVPNGSEEIAIVPGDRWQGLYRFDAVSVDRAWLISGDPIVADAMSGSISPHNDSMPGVDAFAVSVAGTDGGFYVTGSEGAVSDRSGIARARIVNPETSAYYWFSVKPDGSFSRVPIAGTAGDVVRIEATDAHPSPLTTAAVVGSLPFNESPPVINDNLQFKLGVDSLPHLVGEPGAVFDAGSSVQLAVTNILTAEVFHVDVSADGSFDLTVEGNVGDDFSLVATDTHPDSLSSDEKIVTLPTLETIFVALGAPSYVVDEGAGTLDVEVMLSAGSSRSVSVSFQALSGTADAIFDFGHINTTVMFEPWSTLEVVSIPIIDNVIVEDDEVFSIELSNPEWAELGLPSVAVVTIVDDEVESRTAAFSIAVGGGEWIDESLIVDISNGVASFAGAPPPGPDRGSRVTVAGVGDFFISSCADDQTCNLVDAFGNAPANVPDATITGISPAFTSLAEAVTRLKEPDHLGTGDLVGLGLNLELLCYAGPSDTTPVLLEGWTTSIEHRINIIAPTGDGLRGPSQRHHGSWTEDAYRLEVYGQPAIVSNVGHLSIDGLQIRCDGGQDDWLVGVDAGAPDDGGSPIRGQGSETKAASEGLEISNTIIAVSGRNTEGIYQMGIRSDLPVHVRNSIVYDPTGTAGSMMMGIAGPWVEALNNTVIGGGLGIQAGIGTAVNNLVLDSSVSGFSGEFGNASGGNLYTVHNAPTPPPPNPPKNVIGPVVFANPGVGIGSDYHLECGVLSQGPAVTTNFPVDNVWELQAMFDGDPESVVTTGEDFDKAEITLEFSEPHAITGTAVELSNYWAHSWMLEAAMTAEELVPSGASYLVLVPDHRVEHTERVYEHIGFESAQVFQAMRLTVWREDGTRNVHIVDWWLDALNPACGQGIDLTSRSGNPVNDDVDGIVRTGSWDIGADQSTDVEVGFAGTARWWWESEEEARIEVVLTQPVEDTVTVRYRTHNLDPISAIAGVDYDSVEG